MKKNKNYKLRGKIYRSTGISIVGASTLAGFFAYQGLTDWNALRNDVETFLVVNQETAKLNLAVAFPLLISSIVFIFIMMKKNKEFFKDKMSLSLFLTITVLYLFYSIIEIAMFSLMGAFAGSVVDEFIFLPLSKRCAIKAQDIKEIDAEYDKEIKRISARKRARESLDGSV